jgi:hypothetical protein
MANVCDFTQPDGTVTEQQAQQAPEAFSRGELTAEEASLLINTHGNQTALPQCSQGGGLSRAAIGAGILGLGVVAVALSQRDE